MPLFSLYSCRNPIHFSCKICTPTFTSNSATRITFLARNSIWAWQWHQHEDEQHQCEWDHLKFAQKLFAITWKFKEMQGNIAWPESAGDIGRSETWMFGKWSVQLRCLRLVVASGRPQTAKFCWKIEGKETILPSFLYGQLIANFLSFLFYPKQKPNQIGSAIALPSFLPPQLNIAASPTTTTTNEWTRGRVSAQVANVISIKRKQQLEQLLLVLVSLALSRPSPPIPNFI